MLTIEIVAKIWDHLSLVDLLRYGATNHMLRDDVHNALRDTVHELLGHFCDDPVDFLANMLHNNAIISGSVALYALSFVHFSSAGRSAKGWFPNDMDIYVPLTQHPHDSPPPIIAYLGQSHGYSLRLKLDHLDLQYPNSEIFEIYHLFKDDKKIDVIVSITQSAIRPLFRFHGSCVMNCITGSGIFSAYPKLTCNSRGLFNPMSTMSTALLPHLPAANVRIALNKYRSRGFDIRYNPACWEGDRHICSIDPYCPHAMRWVTDPACLFIQLRASGVNTVTNIHLDQYSIINDVGETPCNVIWHLGGDDCNGRRSRIRGFVQCRHQRGMLIDQGVIG